MRVPGLPPGILPLLLLATAAAGCSKDPAAEPVPAASSSDRAPLRVGIEAKYPPFETVTPEGKFEGFDIDLVQALGEHLGRPVQFRDLAWDALIPELQAGRIDLVCSGMSYTEERAKLVDFSRPYAQSPMRVLVSTERAKDVTKVEQLKEVEAPQIAVQRGTTGETKARAAFPEANFLLFDTEADAAREVASGRVHAFVYDELSVRKFAQQYPKETRILEGDLGSERYCMVVAKGSSLRARIDAFLDEATRPGGKFDAIAARWLPEPEHWRVPPK